MRGVTLDIVKVIRISIIYDNCLSCHLIFLEGMASGKVS